MEIVGNPGAAGCVVGKTLNGRTVAEYCDLDTLTTTSFCEITSVKGCEVGPEIGFFNWQTSDPENSQKAYQVKLLSQPYTGNPGKSWLMWWD